MISAINRFKVIVNEYDNTIYIEEALYRLVEVYYILGLEKEANYAKLVGITTTRQNGMSNLIVFLIKNMRQKRKL